VVFGSGGFRRMPENLSRERVFELVSCFLVLLEGIARENSITVVIEPLNLSETNIINTTEEAMEYISALSLPNLCLLVDLYHFYRENEPMERVYEYGKYIKHVHIAEPTKRGFMTLQDEYNYTPFFKALRDIEYKGSIVFEGGGGDFDEGIANALKVLKYGKKIIVE
ncbi:MAG: sugar phosphate isomerase/epimerase, partial [Clostridiales bacterium]|nr:sugar phosphate isomerase/epimerase [Clostridiales bacterium]